MAVGSPGNVSVSPLVKYSVFLGIFLTRILDCIPWVWGNLSVYVSSYYYHRGDRFADSLTNWMVMVNITGFNIGMAIAGTLGRKIGEIPTMLIFILVYNVALFLSYFTLDYSAIAMCVTFGGITGLGSGVIQSTQLTLIVRWTEKYFGLTTSSVPSSNIAVSIIMNLAATWYINPTNLPTDSTVNKMAIFTQMDLINNVPPALLYFAVFSTVLNVIGFLLLRNEPGCGNVFSEASLVLRRMKICQWKESGLKESSPLSTSATSGEGQNNNVETRDGENDGNQLEQETRTTSNGVVTQNYNDTSGGSSYTSFPNSDVTPREALRRKEFYTLWFFIAIQTYAFFLKSTYYKTFGLLYIPDDHFLTLIGIINCGVSPVCAWASGYFMDKFGVKPTIMAISSLLGVVASLFYLSVADKWLYLVSCVVYGSTVFVLYCLTAACCVKLFGQTYFTTIFGMTLTSGLLLTFTVPPLAGWVIATYGWFVLFITAGFLAFVNLLILIWGLPDH